MHTTRLITSAIRRRLLTPYRSLSRIAQVAIPLLAVLVVAGFGAGAVEAFVVHQPGAPQTDLGARQAADIQSVLNVWYAYDQNETSDNAKGVAALETPTGGYTFQQDAPGMAPSACQPEPGTTTTCINTGGCAALGHASVEVFLPAVGYIDPKPWPSASIHTLATPLVTLGPGDRTATLSIYYHFGRYINDFVNTPSGWKMQWERVIWPNIGSFNCRVDWSQTTNKPGLLGTDLYYLQLPVNSPRLPLNVATNPSFAKVNDYIVTALGDVNAGRYSAACPTINRMVSDVKLDPGLDADHRNYLTTIATRFLEDDACNGLTPPDRTTSDGSWAAATEWQAYHISGVPNQVPTPAGVPPFSSVAAS